MQLKVYTIKELAKLLRIHRTYVSRLIKEGKINALKFGRSYRVLSEDIFDFLGEETKKPLLKIEEAATILRIHRLYVVRLIEEKKLKAIKIGKFYRISNKSVDDFIGQKNFSRLFTINEVARLLSFSRATILALIKKKRLKAIRIGKFYLISEKNIKKFLKAKELV